LHDFGDGDYFCTLINQQQQLGLSKFEAEQPLARPGGTVCYEDMAVGTAPVSQYKSLPLHLSARQGRMPCSAGSLWHSAFAVFDPFHILNLSTKQNGKVLKFFAG
jgi:hypothetical protein